MTTKCKEINRSNIIDDHTDGGNLVNQFETFHETTAGIARSRANFKQSKVYGYNCAREFVMA